MQRSAGERAGGVRRWWRGGRRPGSGAGRTGRGHGSTRTGRRTTCRRAGRAGRGGLVRVPGGRPVGTARRSSGPRSRGRRRTVGCTTCRRVSVAVPTGRVVPRVRAGGGGSRPPPQGDDVRAAAGGGAAGHRRLGATGQAVRVPVVGGRVGVV